MALLAWTAFAFDAFAHPLMMGVEPAPHAMATTASMSSSTDGMPGMPMSNTACDGAPTQPTANGHGCCQNAHCHCASFCSGIAGAPNIAMTTEPLRGPTFTPVGDAAVPAWFTLLLRPPIA